MVGTALKKYAADHGMVCDGGYIYGKVRNRYIALVDGIGVKMLQVYICPPSLAEDEILTIQVRNALEDCDVREYRLIRQNAVNVGKGRAVVVFQDGIGAMERIARYIDTVLPRLDRLETTGDVCACCGGKLEGEAKHVLLDDYILPVHGTCVDRIMKQARAEEPEHREENAVRGAAGAAIGAIAGAAVLAAVYMMGLISGVAGMLVGFLSNLLYGKFGGKNGRTRAAVVAVAIVLGVLLGQMGGVTAVYSRAYDEKGGAEATGLTRFQYVSISWEVYTEPDQTRTLGRMYDRICGNVSRQEKADAVSREEYIQANLDADYAAVHEESVREFIMDLCMGVFFGALGCLSLFFQKNKQSGRRIIRKLK